MKMKKTDIGVVVVMYAICAYWFSETVKLKADSQTYPRFTIYLLFGLTTLYLVQMLVAAKKHGVESGVDKVFKDFLPVQFFVCLAAVVVYLFLVKTVGFYVSTVVFMIAVMLYLKVPIKHTVIAVIALNVLIYVAFSQLLGVKLPTGLLI